MNRVPRLRVYSEGKKNADGVPSRLRHTRNHEMDGITRGCDAISLRRLTNRNIH